MKKRPFITSMILTSLLLLTGCTDEPKPEDRFADYTKLWNKQNFEGMYDYLSADAKKEMSEEQFSERYEKIYKGIEMEDLKVEYKLPEELPKHKDEEKVEVTYSVSMETVAGSVEFKNEATLVKEGKDEKENWYIEWGPNYIFPELEEGEKVSVETYPAVRGEIVDRYERGLAINGTVAQVGIVPEKMGEEKATILQVAKLLNMSVEEIEAELNQSWVQPSYFVPIKKLPQNDAKIAKLISIPGVSVTEVTDRVYPYGVATAHLIGYVGEASAEDLEKLKGKGYTANDVIGKRGLEQLLEERLRGEAGAKIYIKADNGTEKVIAERKGKEGEFIALTIDAALQQDIYKQYNNEAGTAAAINPKTGETLALVSSPSFDPNQYVLGMSSAQQKALEENKDKPLLNRFSSTYAPGSTIKALTASVALKNGVNPNKALNIQGLTWKKSNWKDHSITRVANPGIPIDMKNALIYSDNIYFARQALDLGKDKFTSGLKDFGFEDTLPLEYPIKASSIGDISSEGRLADSGYGQGQVQMSAIHLATAYTVFLNEGNVIAPTLIQKDKMEPTVWKKNVITAKQAKQLTGMLKQVVTHPKGSAHSLNDLKLDIAAKTGTAEIKASKNSTGTENGWLVAMDTKSSSLLMAWMIEDVKGRGGSHFVVDRMKPVLKKYIQ